MIRSKNKAKNHQKSGYYNVKTTTYRDHIYELAAFTENSLFPLFLNYLGAKRPSRRAQRATAPDGAKVFTFPS